MFWIFSAVVMVLFVASKGFRIVALGCAGLFLAAGILVINEDAKKYEAKVAQQAIERAAEPARKLTMEELLAD